MDIALKQRLVGASVLVALGVIFIPMLLDGPADPGRREVAVSLPENPDKPFTERRFEVNTAVQPKPQPANTGTIQAVVEPSTTAPPSGSGVSHDTRPLSAEPAVASGRDTGAEAASEQAVEVATATPDTTPKPSPTNVVTGTNTAGKGWVLQLGSFGNAANAKKVVEKVSAAGYNAYQDKVAVGGRTLYRVRVGHWLDKAEAASAGTRLAERFADLDAKLQWDGTGGQLAPSTPLRGYMVQVGAFGQQANALGLRDRLRASGYSAHVVSGTGKHRVLVGPELDRATAEGSRDSLKRKMKLSGIVVSHP